jgi:predicted sulfurtransferase
MVDFLSKKVCDRCGKPFVDNVRTTSMFNTQTICMVCKEKERQHKDYRKAVEADRAAIRAGNYNFGGIGLPKDL